MPFPFMMDVCGPTTVHLRHEGYLLISLGILTLATFQSVYGEEFGTPGDYIFIFLSVLWLSRYILVRWMCTWDPSTSANPSVRSVFTHWITSYCTAGQCFDPSLLTSSPVRYTWNFVLVRVIFPFLKYQERNDTSLTTNSRYEGLRAAEDITHSQAQSQSFRRKGGVDRDSTSSMTGPSRMVSTWQKMFQALHKVAPSIQTLIPACTLVYYTWRLPFAKNLFPFSGAGKNGIDDMKWFGSSHSKEQPAWSEVFFVVSVPTVISLLAFMRLINPMPDLVAGSNVLKAVRNEAKTFGGVNSKSSKSKVQKDNQESPWIEQNSSIVALNRLKLILLVALLRILENLFVALVLPLSGYACRATGHCDAGVQLWQLSTLLFPVGITTPLRTDGNTGNTYDYKADYFTTLLVATSIVAVSALLLLAQAVTLNGSYLAIMGYICGEWTQVEAPVVKNSINNPSQWDPRRRYKKGDIIVVNRSFWFTRQAFYKATSNSPEGRPFDMFLRVTHDMFRNELGHPATSRILAVASHWHLVFIAVLVAMTLGNALLRGNYSNGMLATVVANLVACYGGIGLTRRRGLQKLSEEIRL